MNTVYFIVQEMLFFSIPLLIVSLGGLFSEKSGVTNIALEGIMIIGAFSGVVIINLLNGKIPSQLLLFVAIAAAGFAGGLYSLLHAWASVRLKADQTISGTALNIFAPAFCIFASRVLFGSKSVGFSDTFHIDKIRVLGDIPVLGKMFFQNCYLSTWFGFAVLIAVSFVFRKTRLGLRISACGENPDAAASAGIRVTGMRYLGVLLSGALGGFGGIIFIIPTSTSFAATVAGYGFLALAVLILGQWNPIKILLASFFFGLLKAMSSAYSGIPFFAKLSVPSELYKIIPYVLTLLVLAVSSENSRSPGALGAVYDSGNKTSRKRKKIAIGIVAAVLTVSVISASLLPPVQQKKNAVSGGYGADIALLLDANGAIDDESYIQSFWEGAIAYSDFSGMTRKYYLAENTSEEAMKKCVNIAIKGKAGFLLIPSNNYEKVVGELQWKYPESLFVLFDAQPIDPATGEITYADNTISVGFAEEEAGFLAGYAAVCDGFRSLGFIGGLAVPAVIRYGYGFAYGCEYAAGELGLKQGEVSLKYHYAGTFLPNPECQAMASAWYHSGTEVIFACAGGMGDSVIKAAENTGGYVIEPDLDKSKASETVLTSATKDIDTALNEVLEAYRSGTLETGRDVHLTAAEKCVALPMETSRFRTFSKQDYDSMYKRLADGIITVPDDSAAPSVEQLGLTYTTVRFVK